MAAMVNSNSESTSGKRVPRARLEDVARLAGVSTKTASRVFSGDNNVAEKTKAKVLEAAKRLRFRPNIVARSLRSGGFTSTGGLVVGDLGNPFYFTLAAGIERELASNGMNLIVGTTEDSPEIEMQVVNTMLAQQVRALLIVPSSSDHSYLEGERMLGTPLIFVDREPTNLIADSLTLTNFEGAKVAAECFIAQGHKRIAFVANRAHLGTIQDRRRGYHQAMFEAGLGLDNAVECLVDSSEGALEDAFAKLLSDPRGPTAVVGGNNRASIAYLKNLRQSGPRVAYIGFDDFELADALGISVVSFDTTVMGSSAAKMAIERISSPSASARREKIPTQLVLRGSEIAPS